MTRLLARVTDKLVLKVKAVDLTAEDWQLYTGSMDCSWAAQELNKAAKKALNADTIEEAHSIFEKAQMEYRTFGAFDTEPRDVFAELAAKLFGDEARSWYGMS